MAAPTQAPKNPSPSTCPRPPLQSNQGPSSADKRSPGQLRTAPREYKTSASACCAALAAQLRARRAQKLEQEPLETHLLLLLAILGPACQCWRRTKTLLLMMRSCCSAPCCATEWVLRCAAHSLPAWTDSHVVRLCRTCRLTAAAQCPAHHCLGSERRSLVSRSRWTNSGHAPASISLF